MFGSTATKPLAKEVEQAWQQLIKPILGQVKAKDEAQALAYLQRQEVPVPTFFVGAGTCGLAAGADQTILAIKNYLKEHNLQGEVVEVGCIGMCSAEPIMDIQLPGKARVSFQKMTADKVPALIDKVLAGAIPSENLIGQFKGPQTPWPNVGYFDEHPFFKDQTRWVLVNCGVTNPTSIEEYLARGGYQGLLTALLTMTPAQVCDEVEASGLRGRGGAGFPTGRKWKLVKQDDGQKYMICNADEGDPGAFMDRAVIESDPHRMLEGLMIAAYAIGATKAYVYIRAEYPLAIVHLKQAIAQAQEMGILGEHVCGTKFHLDIIIKMGAGAFVCGEETALMHSIEGKRGMPRPRPPYPAVAGLFGRPTAINNVETLANIANIIRYGAKWFTQVGTEKSKGTKVFALSGRVCRTGLVEIPMGMSIRNIIENIGGGIENGKQFKAVQFGGPSGGCISAANLDLAIDYESLKSVGAMVGSGGMVVMDETTCMVDIARFFMDFIQKESCGKCTPCREGTRSMLTILTNICHGLKDDKGRDLPFEGLDHLERLGKAIKDASLCGLGQSASNPVLSTLRWFREEYESHIKQRKCPAHACTSLLTFSIDPHKCVGCGVCKKACPVQAITGDLKKPHVIDPLKCIRCRACYNHCKIKAVKMD